MADISRVQPLAKIHPVQNQTYKVQGSDGARDQRRHHEEHEAPHDKLELHEEEIDISSETPPEPHSKLQTDQDHSLDIAI